MDESFQQTAALIGVPPLIPSSLSPLPTQTSVLNPLKDINASTELFSTRIYEPPPHPRSPLERATPAQSHDIFAPLSLSQKSEPSIPKWLHERTGSNDSSRSPAPPPEEVSASTHQIAPQSPPFALPRSRPSTPAASLVASASESHATNPWLPNQLQTSSSNEADEKNAVAEIFASSGSIPPLHLAESPAEPPSLPLQSSELLATPPRTLPATPPTVDPMDPFVTPRAPQDPIGQESTFINPPLPTRRSLPPLPQSRPYNSLSSSVAQSITYPPPSRPPQSAVLVGTASVLVSDPLEKWEVASSIGMPEPDEWETVSNAGAPAGKGDREEWVQVSDEDEWDGPDEWSVAGEEDEDGSDFFEPTCLSRSREEERRAKLKSGGAAPGGIGTISVAVGPVGTGVPRVGTGKTRPSGARRPSVDAAIAGQKHHQTRERERAGRQQVMVGTLTGDW